MRTSSGERPHRTAAAVLALGIAAALIPLACNPFNKGETCSPACESTFRCDETDGVCRPKPLTNYRSDAPARRLASAVVGDEAFVAAIAPDRRLVVAGRPGDLDSYVVLDRLDNADRAAVAIGGDADRLYVAWLAGGAYRLATRRGGDWTVDEVAADGDYRGSRHFDLASAAGRPYLVFRDRQAGGLMALVDRPDGPWTLQAIDDGTAADDRSQCPAAVGDPSRTGVGFEPDAAWIDGTVFVSYYDADCGDLRLARHSGDTWGVSVIDTGDYILDVAEGIRESGDVGRFSSLAADTEGNVAVAYQDVGRGRLLFAQETSSGFDVQLVDPGIQLDEFSQKRKQLVGAFADLAFQRVDNNDVPYIAYMNASETQIRLAYRVRRSDSNQWLHRTLDPEPPTGFFTAIEAPTASGIVVFAERLDPTDDGIVSRLVRMEQEVP